MPQRYAARRTDDTMAYSTNITPTTKAQAPKAELKGCADIYVALLQTVGWRVDKSIPTL